MPGKEGYGWGTVQGRKVHEALNHVVENSPAGTIFVISLAGIRHTDVSFARESVVSLIKRYRREYYFCLADLLDKDLVENWDLAAKKLEQPLTVWNGEKATIIGPEPTEGTRDMLDYVLSVPIAYTSEAAAKLDLKIANASNKLKKLAQEGYILQQKRSAPSGGIEYEYSGIK